MSDEPRGFTYYGRTPKGVEMALNMPAAGATANEIAQHLAQLDAALAAVGFTPSARLEPRGFGGGGGGRPGMPRPDDPPPADLVIPEHCERPMRYKREKPAADGRKAVAARWECALGRDCAEAEERNGNKYPATNWHLTKKTGAAAAAPAAAAPPPAPAGPPQGYGDFLNRALKLGYTRPEILKFAHTNEDELKKFGPDQWQELLEKLEAEKQTAAPAA